MTSPQDFLTAFAKEIVHNVDTRPQIVEQWTEKLEAREAEMRQRWYEQFEKGLSLRHSPVDYDEQVRAVDALEAARKAAGLE
jgi:hypothetical protein